MGHHGTPTVPSPQGCGTQHMLYAFCRQSLCQSWRYNLFLSAQRALGSDKGFGNTELASEVMKLAQHF